MRMIGWFIVAGLVAASAISLGHDFRYFIDFPSAVFVVGIVIGGIWAAYGPGRACGAVIRALKGRPSNAADLRVELGVLRLAHQLSWAAGIVGMLIQLVTMLGTMDDPAAIGASIAGSLVSVLYGAVLAEFVFNPLQHSRIAETDNDLTEGGLHGVGSLTKGTMACGLVFVVLALFFFLTATRSPPSADLVRSLRDRFGHSADPRPGNAAAPVTQHSPDIPSPAALPDAP
ncbi:MAG: hypothetical protein U1E05_22775 [Patescibacteria group bacterium]|nr:hypothetical protein [Patescibacteria group bacterium]